MAKAQPILPSKVRRAEFGRTIYSATLEEGVSAADALKSDFWVHLAPQLEPLDHIEAVTADGETYLELLVSRVEKINDGPRTVRIPKIVVLHQVEIGAEAATPADDGPDPSDEDGDGVPDGYKVTFGGPVHKYRVLKDGVTDPLASGMSKKDAIAWAVDHAKKSA